MMKTKELVLASGAVLLIMVSGIKAGTQYQFIDLGTLGGNWSASYGINNLGQIVGGSGTDLGPNRATLFDATGGGNNIDLGTTGEVRGGSIAMDINNSGQVIGYGGYDNNLATLFDLESPYGNLNLGTLGGDASRAYGINDLGQIVGEAQLPSGNWRATLFDPSGLGNNIGLGTLGGGQSEAREISNAGQIVGSAETTPRHFQSTLFDSSGAGVNKSLDLALASHANSINNSGQIAGQSLARAALFDQFDSSKNVQLGGSYSEAHAINDQGQIVGYATPVPGERHATLFDPSGGRNNIDLNDHAVGRPQDWVLREARDINDNGWIVGEGQNPEGQRRAFLLTPQKTIENVPQYRWNHGCTPTAAGMLMAYWDKKFPDLVDGDPPLVDMTSESKPRTDWRPWHYVYESNYGDPTVNRLIATQEHFSDWWDDNVLIPGWDDKDDPLPNGIPHSDNCLADYLGTSRGSLGNGATTPDPQKITQALRSWAYYRGYTPKDGYLPVVGDNRNPTFDDLKREIEKGRPVLVHLSLDGQGGKPHSVLVYGYRDQGAGEQWYAVMDTWPLSDPHLGTKIKSEISELGTEWWKWSNEAGNIAALGYINTFSISEITGLAPSDPIKFCDAFDRIKGNELAAPLGYNIIDDSADYSGEVTITDSPIEVDNPLLKMASTTGDPISITTPVEVLETVEISFQYLFNASGKLNILLDGVKLDTLTCPLEGPGSPGSGIPDDYFATLDLDNFGMGSFGCYDFQLSLSGVDGSVIYIDDLDFNSIPEPASVLLLVSGFVVVLLKR